MDDDFAEPADPGDAATRPGRALLVAHPDSATDAQSLLENVGYDADTVPDPYAAMLDLVHRPLVYRAVVLSLPGVYRKELSLIASVARRFPHVERFVCHTDGRSAALAEALALGATGVVDDEGVHAFAAPAAPKPPAVQRNPVDDPDPMDLDESPASLTPEELRALLNDM